MSKVFQCVRLRGNRVAELRILACPETKVQPNGLSKRLEATCPYWDAEQAAPDALDSAEERALASKNHTRRSGPAKGIHRYWVLVGGQVEKGSCDRDRSRGSETASWRVAGFER